jgi:tripartite-type tricarboxylate transporter receptor subunit TctC
MKQKLRAVTKMLAMVPLAIFAAGTSVALANDAFPDRPITLVVPFGAGGGTDVLGRLLAEHMSEGLGQPVVVENRPGAGGSIGTSQVAKSKPDGYTILLGTSSTHGINPVVYSNLPYDAITDFAPIGLVATNQFVAAVPGDFPAGNLAEFRVAVEPKPEDYNYGSSGNGTTSHMAGALFVQASGLPLEHIPYTSNGPALIDLMAGRVSLMFDNITAMQQQIEAGTIRPIGTTGRARSPILPDVATLEEQGLAGYHIGGWFGMLAPAGTPAPVVDKLSVELARVLQIQAVSDRMKAVGADPEVSTPAEFQAWIQAEIPRWKEIVDLAGAKIE